MPSPGTSDKIIPSGGDLGTGRACPVTRNFEVADQASANNVTTEYLLNPLTGQTAQDTTSNAGNIAGATLLFSRSDDTLLDQFLDPILGCTPFQAPDLANNDQPTSFPGAGRDTGGRVSAEDRGAGAGERRGGAAAATANSTRPRPTCTGRS